MHQHSSQVTRGCKSMSRNLATIIDFQRIHCGHIRGGSHQGVHVDRSAAVLPKHYVSVYNAIWRGVPNNLGSRINRKRFAIAIAGQGPEIGDGALTPENCENCSSVVACADDIAGVVDPKRIAEAASQ